ncbi:4'-phosphopantetheinyl transferase family protein [Bailinhaonella thermotolerans]|uniref:4-phosphopantetheinyl transferase family protein n=1 Tax=Bailinhaonella thermotolerans TaxID=1070861 RepID=A0A3A4ARC3_9ACTN|nr:4'-phosphopantetheinyl transferase superfamily protein [Bailinhaonella thermotolerans]RJL31651.1 4-phosphopantetheinyl transferase family protein [Bailinhaonella thermotolerans]
MRDLDVEVWWAPRGAAGPHLLPLLDPGERERWSRFRREEDRDRYLASHALARLLLGRRLGIEPASVEYVVSCRTCGASDHGKPAVDGGPAFSLSHSGEAVVVALAGDAGAGAGRDAPPGRGRGRGTGAGAGAGAGAGVGADAGAGAGVELGVDVELVKTLGDHSSLARMALSAREREELAGRPPADPVLALLTSWSRKEALLKATGDGLSGGLTSLTLTRGDEPPRLLSWPHRPSLDVALRDLTPPPGHVAALAVLGAEPRVSEHDGSALLAPG